MDFELLAEAVPSFRDDSLSDFNSSAPNFGGAASLPSFRPTSGFGIYLSDSTWQFEVVPFLPSSDFVLPSNQDIQVDRNSDDSRPIDLGVQ